MSTVFVGVLVDRSKFVSSSQPLTGPRSPSRLAPYRISFLSKPCSYGSPRLGHEGRREAVGLLDPGFQGLVEKKGIPERLQGTLSNVGVRMVSRFSVIGDAAADVRTFADWTGQERWFKLQAWSTHGRLARPV